MTNLSFFTKYPTQGATSRYRSFAFASRLAQMDYNIETHSFMPIGYLSDLFAGRPKPKAAILVSYLARLMEVLRSGENLIIERELFPLIPYGFESFFLRHKKYILDFDDNVWEDYRGRRLLEGKYDRLVENASGVIVGNGYLADYARRLNPHVVHIPTVIDLDRYRSAGAVKKFDRFSLVWIGSPVTYRYIEAFTTTFRKLAERLDFDLIIIASKKLESRAIPGVSMKFYDWSGETETALLQRSHVGIMPLDDDPFSRGKSGFKLIQYQAAGLPMIASPVGENRRIVEHGANGFLAPDTEGWLDAVQKLASSAELYASMSECSKTKSRDYSIQKYFPIYRDFIDAAFAQERQ